MIHGLPLCKRLPTRQGKKFQWMAEANDTCVMCVQLPLDHGCLALLRMCTFFLPLAGGPRISRLSSINPARKSTICSYTNVRGLKSILTAFNYPYSRAEAWTFDKHCLKVKIKITFFSPFSLYDIVFTNAHFLYHIGSVF